MAVWNPMDFWTCHVLTCPQDVAILTYCVSVYLLVFPSFMISLLWLADWTIGVDDVAYLRYCLSLFLLLTKCLSGKTQPFFCAPKPWTLALISDHSLLFGDFEKPVCCADKLLSGTLFFNWRLSLPRTAGCELCFWTLELFAELKHFFLYSVFLKQVKKKLSELIASAQGRLTTL